MASDRGIRIIRGSDNDIWRMSRDNSEGVSEILHWLVEIQPDLDESIEAGGLIWLLAGAAYPVNIGFCIRTAEVSGADAVIVDAELSNTERKVKKSVNEGSQIHSCSLGGRLPSCEKAKDAGFRIISVEDTGTKSPGSRTTGNIVLIVGERRKESRKTFSNIRMRLSAFPLTDSSLIQSTGSIECRL